MMKDASCAYYGGRARFRSDSAPQRITSEIGAPEQACRPWWRAAVPEGWKIPDVRAGELGCVGVFAPWTE